MHVHSVPGAKGDALRTVRAGNVFLEPIKSPCSHFQPIRIENVQNDTYVIDKSTFAFGVRLGNNTMKIKMVSGSAKTMLVWRLSMGVSLLGRRCSS